MSPRATLNPQAAALVAAHVPVASVPAQPDGQHLLAPDLWPRHDGPHDLHPGGHAWSRGRGIGARVDCLAHLLLLRTLGAVLQRRVPYHNVPFAKGIVLRAWRWASQRALPVRACVRAFTAGDHSKLSSYALAWKQGESMCTADCDQFVSRFRW